jgi:CTP synthase (UTP-ammonia lyase)
LETDLAQILRCVRDIATDLVAIPEEENQHAVAVAVNACNAAELLVLDGLRGLCFAAMQQVKATPEDVGGVCAACAAATQKVNPLLEICLGPKTAKVELACKLAADVFRMTELFHLLKGGQLTAAELKDDNTSDMAEKKNQARSHEQESVSQSIHIMQVYSDNSNNNNQQQQHHSINYYFFKKTTNDQFVVPVRQIRFGLLSSPTSFISFTCLFFLFHFFNFFHICQFFHF